MNKIRVIKKHDRAVVAEGLDIDNGGGKPSRRELVDVVGAWVSDWRTRSEINARHALDDCARFRAGSSRFELPPKC